MFMCSTVFTGLQSWDAEKSSTLLTLDHAQGIPFLLEEMRKDQWVHAPPPSRPAPARCIPTPAHYISAPTHHSPSPSGMGVRRQIVTRDKITLSPW